MRYLRGEEGGEGEEEMERTGRENEKGRGGGAAEGRK